MSLFTTVWLWTLFRCALLILLALPFCRLLVQWLKSTRGHARFLQWALLTTPFLFPELLTGYAYGQMTRLLITGAWFREFWFDLLLFSRVVPVGTLLWYFAPPSPLSREAIHARVMAFRESDGLLKRSLILAWLQLYGPARAGFIAGSGLFLALFQEFELASMLAAKSWTVWLFDAQVEGLPLYASLQFVALPALCSWAVCTVLIRFSLKNPAISTNQSKEQPKLGRWVPWGLWSYLVLALTLVVIYPLILIGMEASQGVVTLLNNHIQLAGLTQGIFIAAGCALIVTTLTDQIAEWIFGCSSQFWRRVIFGLGSLGFGGSLAVAMAFLMVFRLPGMIWLRESPLPVLLGLTVWLLPRAMVLKGITQIQSSPMVNHTVNLLDTAEDSRRQLAAEHLRWLIRGRSQFATRALLFHWAYWDLTIPHLLNPTGWVPAPVRLYGDAHFARNAVLTAKAGITLLAPLVILIAIWSAIGFWRRIRYQCMT